MCHPPFGFGPWMGMPPHMGMKGKCPPPFGPWMGMPPHMGMRHKKGMKGMCHPWMGMGPHCMPPPCHFGGPEGKPCKPCPPPCQCEGSEDKPCTCTPQCQCEGSEEKPCTCTPQCQCKESEDKPCPCPCPCPPPYQCGGPMGMPPFGGLKHHRHHGHKGKHGKMAPPPFQMPYCFNPYGMNMQYSPESPNLTFGQDNIPTELEEYDPNTMPNVAGEENDKINPNTSATFAEVAAADAAADEAEGKDPAAPPKEPVPQVVPGFDL